MGRFYLAALLAFALLASIFLHPIFGLVIFAVGIVTPILPAWLGVLSRQTIGRISTFALLPLFVLALASCSTASKLKDAYLVASSTAVTTQQAGLLISGYQASYAVANQYLALPICAKNAPPCRDKDIAAKINKVLDVADPRAETLIADIKTAKAQCKAAGTPDDQCTIPVLKEAYDLLFASKNDLVAATPTVTASN
ncbi:hypothetical protein LMIY3S_03719 [Labrys miyagiensis]